MRQRRTGGRTVLEDLLDRVHDTCRTVVEACQPARVVQKAAELLPAEVVLELEQQVVDDFAAAANESGRQRG